MRSTRVFHKAIALFLSGSVLHFCSVATFAGELEATAMGGAERAQGSAGVSLPMATTVSKGLQTAARFTWRDGRLVTSNPALVLNEAGARQPKIGFESEKAADPAAGVPLTLAAPASTTPVPVDAPATTGGQKIMAFLILGGLAALSIALVIHATNQKDPQLGARTPTRVIP